MTTFHDLRQKLTEALSSSFDLIGTTATIDLLIEILDKLMMDYKSRGEDLKASSIKAFAEKLKALKVF